MKLDSIARVVRAAARAPSSPSVDLLVDVVALAIIEAAGAPCSAISTPKRDDARRWMRQDMPDFAHMIDAEPDRIRDITSDLQRAVTSGALAK